MYVLWSQKLGKLQWHILKVPASAERSTELSLELLQKAASVTLEVPL